VAAVSAAGVPVNGGRRPVPVPRLEANPRRPGELRLRDEKSKIGRTMSGYVQFIDIYSVGVFDGSLKLGSMV